MVTIVDNIGLPYSGLNLSYSTSAPIGPADADIQVQLTPKHHPTDEYVQELRGVLAREYPGRHLLRAARGHRDADSELRPFRAHRYSDCRAQSVWQPRGCGKNAERSPLCSRRGRCAHSAALRLSEFDRECGPHARAGDWLYAAGCGAESSGGPERQLPDDAEFLSRSEKRRQLQRCRADAAIQAGFDVGACRACRSHGQGAPLPERVERRWQIPDQILRRWR